MSHSVTIQPMTTEDVSEVLALWEGIEGLILTATDNVEDLSCYFQHNPGLSQVAIHDESVVGAVLCGHDGRRGYLHHLAVTAEYQKQGIGRALVRECMSKLRNVGIRQCNLFLIADNADGRRFWENDGWSEWPEIRLMSKTIEG